MSDSLHSLERVLDYERMAFLTRGTYNSIYEVPYRDSERRLILRRTQRGETVEESVFQDEVGWFQKMESLGVGPIVLGHVWKERRGCIYLERFTCNLNDFLDRTARVAQPEPIRSSAKFIFSSLNQQVRTLVDEGLCFLDISVRNVLLRLSDEKPFLKRASDWEGCVESVRLTDFDGDFMIRLPDTEMAQPLAWLWMTRMVDFSTRTILADWQKKGPEHWNLDWTRVYSMEYWQERSVEDTNSRQLFLFAQWVSDIWCGADGIYQKMASATVHYSLPVIRVLFSSEEREGTYIDVQKCVECAFVYGGTEINRRATEWFLMYLFCFGAGRTMQEVYVDRLDILKQALSKANMICRFHTVQSECECIKKTYA